MNAGRHLPTNIRQVRRGHWEGNTLVVDVTNSRREALSRIEGVRDSQFGLKSVNKKGNRRRRS
jgi:hypothetical protein